MTSSKNGSAAFQWLDANMISSADAPDEAFDWVYMTTQDDWDLLQSVWDSRCAHWREALAYVVIQGPADKSRPILRRALYDEVEGVAQQAAVSLCAQAIDCEEAPPIDDELVNRLREIMQNTSHGNMEPVPEYLASRQS